MITEIIKLPEKSKEDIANEKLVEVFNKEAKEQKSKYLIKFKYGCHIHLVRNWLFFEAYDQLIVYIGWKDIFVFVRGIDKEVFNEIKPILEKIPIKFRIELI